MRSWLGSINPRFLWWGLLLAFFLLRQTYLAYLQVPVLNQDEAALLLNARLIWEIGQDEWGRRLPLTFASFGDYKLPGYIYLTSLTGGLLGFSSWIVRLPSLLAGVGMVWVVYRIGRELSSERAGFWSALLLALSPWSWHYGTTGFEANLGLFLFLSALLCVLLPFRLRNFLLAALCLIGAGITYNAPFLLSPAIFIVAVMRHFSVVSWKRIGLGLLAVLLAIFTIFFITWPATEQKQGISLFQHPSLLNEYPTYRQAFSSAIEQKLFGNKMVYFARFMLQNFLESWRWDFLVLRGGENPWHTTPGLGHLLWVIPPFAVVGFVLGLQRFFSKAWLQSSAILLFLTLASLLPAVITVDAPHATRSLFFFVMLSLSAGYAFSRLLPRIFSLASAISLAICVLSFLVWCITVPTRWQTEVSSKWYRGFEQALSQVEEGDLEVYVLDPEGVLYTRVAVAQDLPSREVLDGLVHSAPNTAGIVRGERLGRYHFVFAQEDAKSNSVFLFPTSSTEWSIIKL